MKKLASGFASVGACVLRRVGIIKFPPPSKILKGPILRLGIGRIVALCAVLCLTCCTYQAYTVRYSVDYADYINSGFWIFHQRLKLHINTSLLPRLRWSTERSSAPAQRMI